MTKTNDCANCKFRDRCDRIFCTHNVQDNFCQDKEPKEHGGI